MQRYGFLQRKAIDVLKRVINMTISPRKPNTLFEQAPEGLWACSQALGSRLIWGVEPAGLERWACWIDLMSLLS